LILGFGVSISAYAGQGFFCEKTVPSAWYFVTGYWRPVTEEGIKNPHWLGTPAIEEHVSVVFSGEAETSLGARLALRDECLSSGLVALTEGAAQRVLDSMTIEQSYVYDLGTRENVLRQTCTALSRRARCESYRIDE
jgi:hypothetical protein